MIHVRINYEDEDTDNFADVYICAEDEEVLLSNIINHSGYNVRVGESDRKFCDECGEKIEHYSAKDRDRLNTVITIMDSTLLEHWKSVNKIVSDISYVKSILEKINSLKWALEYSGLNSDDDFKFYILKTNQIEERIGELNKDSAAKKLEMEQVKQDMIKKYARLFREES